MPSFVVTKVASRPAAQDVEQALATGASVFEGGAAIVEEEDEDEEDEAEAEQRRRAAEAEAARERRQRLAAEAEAKAAEERRQRLAAEAQAAEAERKLRAADRSGASRCFRRGGASCLRRTTRRSRCMACCNPERRVYDVFS